MPFALKPGPWRWTLAFEVALALLVAAGTLLAAGHAPLALLCPLGAFTGTYFADRPRRERALVLPWVATGLVAAAAAGVASAGQPAVISIAALSLVAVAATLLTQRHASGPPGPLMFVLACGAGEFVAARMRLAGSAGASWSIPWVVAWGGLVAWAVVAVPLLFTGPGAAVQHVAGRTGQVDRKVIARLAIAVAAAGIAGTLLGDGRVYWIVLTAVAVLYRSALWPVTLGRAIHRVAGTLAGLGVFALLLALHPAPVPLLLALCALVFATEAVIARSYALAMAFITPTALLVAVAGGSDTPLSLALLRLEDTLIGTLLALAVA